MVCVCVCVLNWLVRGKPFTAYIVTIIIIIYYYFDITCIWQRVVSEIMRQGPFFADWMVM